MHSTEIAPVLSIGAVLGDSDAENMAWKRAIGELGKQVVAAREAVASPVNLNVVFHVDGKLAPNEFVGVRAGRFSQATSQLMVQAAVAPGAVDDRRSVLLGLLSAAVDEAELFARRRELADDLSAIRSILVGLPPS
ncbi:hypothetical protein ACLBXX_07695 [Microbacterium sp. C23T]